MSEVGFSSFRPIQIDTSAISGATVDQGGDFVSTLKNALHEVDQLQTNASERISNLLTGKGEDLHSTMIAVEKADVAFQFMIQVRNKIVNAYQEFSRMQF